MTSMRYEPVIGLEVHAELLTRSKMFCGCPVVELTTAEPNTAVCPVCLGLPGSLPVVNRQAVEYTMMVGLALHCRVAELTVWERKSYFYPDMVKNYQISQYQFPLCVEGWLEIEPPAGPWRIRINRAHLEEDTGKTFHVPGGDGGSGAASLIDFNRSGVPLLEIVTEPDMHSVDEVKACAIAVRTILRYLGVSSGDMEKGVIRFEANISVREQGSTALNPRAEIKNLNSFRALVRGVEYEIARQIALYERGEAMVQQTLGWDEERGVTYPQRSKEFADDYRYFPEPDLPPLAISRAWVEQVRAALPELPDAKRDRFMRVYGLNRYDAGLLTAERAVADWYEQAVAAAGERVAPKSVANWVTGEVFRLMRDRGEAIGALRFTPAGLADLIAMVESGQINLPSGKEVLEIMAQGGRTPAEIVAERGLAQISDRGEVEGLVEQILRDNPKQVEDYLGGKEAVLRWFVGQVMKASRGKANPTLVQQVLAERLAQLREG